MRAWAAQPLLGLEDADGLEAATEELFADADRFDSLTIRSLALSFRGDVALLRKDFVECERRYAAGIALAVDAFGAGEAGIGDMDGLALALAGQGRAAKSLRIGGAVQAFCERTGQLVAWPFWTPLQERWFGVAREQLGPEAADARWREGLAMSYEEATEYALDLERD
jgi:hypothetical protein